MIEKIREMFYRWRLKNQKRRGLFEAKCDLVYLRAFKGDMLKYDEGKARKRMSELKAITNRDEKQELELDTVLNVIAESKAVKNEFSQTERLIKHLEVYIDTL